MSFLENEFVRIGIDLNRGGAITFLAQKGGVNLVNNYDLGRQIQMSFFSGPVPFEPKGQTVPDHWKHIGWNPIQAGDDHGNSSPVLKQTNDGKEIYVQCRPLHWPLAQVEGNCLYETWITLEGKTAKIRAKLINDRQDKQAYRARHQEMPAVYSNSPLFRVVSYTGETPYQRKRITEIPKSKTAHPWSFWIGTEGWSALLNQDDFGLGLITPGRVEFTGGFAGKPGPGNTKSNSTGYLAGLASEILDATIHYEYEFELLVGTLQEIRDQAQLHQPKSLPLWEFSHDRASWHKLNADDQGWPVENSWNLVFNQTDPQLISPYFFLNHRSANELVLEAAFFTTDKVGHVFIQCLDEKGFGRTKPIPFSIIGDGKFRTYRIRLDKIDFSGNAIIRLRIDPCSGNQKEEWAKVQKIFFK